MAELLLLEPEAGKARRIRTALSEKGHTCLLCPHASKGLDVLQNHSFTMAIFDARMPWTESASMLKALAARRMPVLFMTANPDNAKHLRALYSARCDVVSTDTEDAELTDAVDRLLTVDSSVLTMGDLALHTDTHYVSVGGREEPLTEQEYALLHALMVDPDMTMTRQELLRTAWGYQSMGITRTVDVHVQRLRRKLGCEYIETIYRLGYRLKPA